MKDGIEKQVWFVTESSRAEAEDWFADGDQTYDNFSSAYQAAQAHADEFDHRVVKKTLTSEAVSMHYAKGARA